MRYTKKNKGKFKTMTNNLADAAGADDPMVADSPKRNST
jgi:hypothetical protein